MTPSTSIFTTEEFRGLEGLRSLRDDWVRLSEQTGHYFHEFNWFVEFVTHDYRPAAELVFVAVSRPDGTVVGIVPMEQRTEHVRRMPCKIWATIGSRLGDVMLFASGSDILCESEEVAFPVLDAVVRHLAAMRPANWLLLVGRLTEGTMALSACRKFSRAVHYDRGAVDWIRTDRSYAELHGELSRKFKASLRNTANRAAAQGTMEFHTSRSDSPDFAPAFASFKKVEASGWKGDAEKGGALATAQYSAQRDFIEGVFSRHGGGAPFVHQFLLDGRCIAALIGVRFGPTVAVLKIGYDESFRRLGPGHLLLRHLVESCCESPDVQKVDMVSHTEWMAPWQPEVKVYRWFYLPIRPILATLPLALLKLPRRG